MVVGVVVPVSVIAIFEIGLWLKKGPATDFENYQGYLLSKSSSDTTTPEYDAATEQENNFGKRMIAIGILVTGFIIGVLGLMAENGRITVIGMAAVLLMIGGRIYFKAKTSKK
jgi:hypothetical protein